MIKSLIYNSDIREIQKKLEQKGSISIDEAALLKQSNWSESRVQQACKHIFRTRFKGVGLFVQTDNARATKAQRMKAGREGYEKGMTDIILVGKNNNVAFVEFKKIGSPSEIDPAEEQKKMQEFLISCRFLSYFCNNTVYFEKVVCGEFAALLT